MTKDRIEQIYKAVVVNAFYDVGEWGAEPGPSDITHDEMVEMVKVVKNSLENKPQKGE